MYTSGEDLSVLDVLQEYIDTRGWKSQRNEDSVLLYKRVGEWTEYTFYVNEHSENCLVLFVPYVLPLPEHEVKAAVVRLKLYELLNDINANMPRGTFSLEWTEHNSSVIIQWAYQFDWVQLDDGTCDALEHLLDEALAEVDGLYPSILWAICSDCSVKEALETAIPPVYGHA